MMPTDPIAQSTVRGGTEPAKGILTLLAVLAVMVLAGGCATTEAPRAFPPVGASEGIKALNEQILAQAQLGGEPGDFLIGAGDLLQISVFEAKELDKTVRVSSRGFISLPLVGEIQVSGLTAIEAEETIEELYRQRYIKDPHVSIFIEEQISQRITLVGQFRNPGTYDYLSNQRLLDGIALGGGLSERAGQIVQVRRTRSVQGEPNTFIVDLDRLIKDGSTGLNIRLNGGDVLFVPEAGVFFVDGAVKKPGVYPIKRNLIVQEGLVEAGGFESWAKTDVVKLVRMMETGERKVIDLDMGQVESKETALQDRDILIVGEAALSGFFKGFSLTVAGTGFAYWSK